MKRYSLSILNDKTFIDKAKFHIEQFFRCFPISGSSVNMNYLKDHNEWLWNLAYTISIADKHGIIIPLKNQVFIPTIKKSNFLYPEFNVLITHNQVSGIYTTLVRLIPDFIGMNCFTGYIEPLVAENKIGNINDYLKCFDNNPNSDHHYEAMLCVSQPLPGSSEPWDFSKKEYSSHGNPFFVGHVFLILKESTGIKNIIRNVGFYPEGNVWPYQPSDQGCLNNDSYSSFNIALNIQLTSHQFKQILGYLSKGNSKGFMYNLNSNNCTNFALDALKEAGIILPRTVGKWHHGNGLNPGNLGEDLRKMRLSSKMKLITVSQPHGNQGSCN